MATIIAAVVVFATAFLGMAIGVVMSNRCLQGSCGGLNQLPEGSGESACGVCGNSAPVADEKTTRLP